jgi:hypothetical protein
MVGCCLQPDALGHFLALRVEVGLIAAALAELARTQWLNAPDARQNAGTRGMPVAARYTDAGYTHAKS